MVTARLYLDMFQGYKIKQTNRFFMRRYRRLSLDFSSNYQVLDVLDIMHMRWVRLEKIEGVDILEN